MAEDEVVEVAASEHGGDAEVEVTEDEVAEDEITEDAGEERSEAEHEAVEEGCDGRGQEQVKNEKDVEKAGESDKNPPEGEKEEGEAFWVGENMPEEPEFHTPEEEESIKAVSWDAKTAWKGKLLDDGGAGEWRVSGNASTGSRPLDGGEAGEWRISGSASSGSRPSLEASTS